MIYEFPKLYGKAKSGATQEWTITCYDDPLDGVYYEVKHGKLNGKLQAAPVYIEEGKNIGKANETTLWEQCIRDARSKWNKQIDKGYTEDINRVGKWEVPKPMLAHDFSKYGHKIKYPSFCQPKFDGVRCLAEKKDGVVTLYSRPGKIFAFVPHINQQLLLLMNDGEIWDGELYNHEASWEDFISAVKREQDDSGVVEYHIYDVVDEEKTFKDRFIDRIFDLKDSTHIYICQTEVVNNEEEALTKLEEYLSLDYEGIIIRHSECMYTQKHRSQHVIKLKNWLEEDFEIVGVKDGKGKFKGLGIFQCVTKEGYPFDCTPVGSTEQRREYFENKEDYIGKLLSVKFIEWTGTDQPVPKHLTGKGVRFF